MTPIPKELNEALTRLFAMNYELEITLKKLKPVYDYYLKVKSHQKNCQKRIFQFYEVLNNPLEDT